MWGWFINNGLWVLICAGVVVVLLLYFNERVRNIIAKLVPAKWKGKAIGSVTAIFWTDHCVCGHYPV